MIAMQSHRPLPGEALRRRCDAASLPFETTDELPELAEVIGQPRAVEALELGMGLRRAGFNLFALGPTGVGVHSVVRQSVVRRAEQEPVPGDWVYVHNFGEAHRPRALRLPAGRGSALRDDMDRLIDDLRTAIPAAFETDEYRARVHVVEEEMKERHQRAFEELEQNARANGLGLIRTPVGMGFAPVRDGAVMDPADFAKLPEAEREEITGRIEKLQEALQEIVGQFPQWQREAKARVREITAEFATHAVRHLLDELRSRYAEVAEIVAYLDGVQADVVEHVDLFRRQEVPSIPGLPELVADADHAALRRYAVNLLVDHRASRGAPVVYEPNPTYQNLVGRVEHRQSMGTLVADFTLIKPGALHLANGGYLVLDARKVLGHAYAWDGLKQALRAGEIRIESLGQVFGLFGAVSLEPEHIPLVVKVVLVDEPIVYYLLHAADPEFRELFKIAAEFDDRMPRDPITTLAYAGFVATQVRALGLRPLDRGAVGRVIEEAARAAGDSQRLTTRMHDVKDLLVESDHRAGLRGSAIVGAADVSEAVAAAIRRADRLRDRLLEETERGTILIDSDGSRVGQVNGLSVLQLGDFAFGRPSRITARVRVGSGQVVDIEREVALGGPLHSKGVLILSSFLAARYAQDEPLSLAASLVFEQSYAGVDGDSASAAELCALLSALADVPLRQSLAVTGSVNQHGEIQAIGGVNEKIEGFFDLCRRRGLTGRQGVLIPRSNLPHLMLRDDVVEAAERGEFSVFAAATIDDAVEVLTELPAGAPDAEGVYPEGSLNRRVQDRLRDFAEKRRRFARPGAAEGTVAP
jgi:lon-related putative ATP-dependent protease